MISKQPLQEGIAPIGLHHFSYRPQPCYTEMYKLGTFDLDGRKPRYQFENELKSVL